MENIHPQSQLIPPHQRAQDHVLNALAVKHPKQGRVQVHYKPSAPVPQCLGVSVSQCLGVSVSRCLGAKFNTPGLAWTFPDHRHPTLGSMRIWPTIPPKTSCEETQKRNEARYCQVQSSSVRQVCSPGESFATASVRTAFTESESHSRDSIQTVRHRNAPC